MFIKILLGFALVGVAFFGNANASSTLTSWGAVSMIATGDCPGDNTCANLSSVAVDPIDGGEGFTSTNVATGDWGNLVPNSAVASGMVSGDLSVPILEAGAVSSAFNWIAGQAIVVQGYEYAGNSTTLDINWNLDGVVTNPDSDGLTGLTVFASIWTPDADLLDADPSILFSQIFFDTWLRSFDSPTTNFASQYITEGSVQDSGTLTFDVEDGSAFYLAMGLGAAASGADAIGDADSTFTASIISTNLNVDLTTVLTPSITTVPIPSALLLFGTGLLGIIGLTKRKKTV